MHTRAGASQTVSSPAMGAGLEPAAGGRFLFFLKGVWLTLRACGTPCKCDLQHCSLKTRLQSTNLPKCFCKQDFHLPKVPWIRAHACPNTSCDLAQPLLATCWAQSLTNTANVFSLSVGSASLRATRREVIHLTKATHFYSFWKHFCCKNNKVKEQEGAVLRYFSNNGPFLLIGVYRTPIFQHCVSQNILKCTALQLVRIYIFYLLKLFTLVAIDAT